MPGIRLGNLKPRVSSPRPRKEPGTLKQAVRVMACGALTVSAMSTLAPATAQADTTRLRVASVHDATVRNGPPARGVGYVIGNALTARPGHKGVAIDLVGPGRRGFRYGQIHGQLNFCAWISVKAKTTKAGRVSTPHCPGGTAGRVLPASKFMYRQSNGKLLRNCEPGKCGDGSSAAVRPARCAAQYHGSVPVYGNVLPWLRKSSPHDRYATIRARSYKVLWRYVSRDGDWVMVRDTHADNSAARRNAGFNTHASNWFFVPRVCVQDAAGKLH
ncbi:hypothetical protein [Actinomadura terrae]|uniref:hypothetical protein n=1 Tax=Actinomadura terrae TaxID=604353 RepID=UPI001FA717BB|nr:hypothetical protein [Actinomadura terrae]